MNLDNKRFNEIRENNKKIGTRSKRALYKPGLSPILSDTLRSFRKDEIGYKSALEVLKANNCTEEEIKYFINHSLVD